MVLLPRALNARQINEKDAASAKFALNADPSAVGLRDMLNNRETEARSAEFSAAGLIYAIKTFEKSIDMLPCDPHPFVLNGKDDFPVVFREADGYPYVFAGVAVVNGIVQQVPYRLFEQGPLDFGCNTRSARCFDGNIFFPGLV